MSTRAHRTSTGPLVIDIYARISKKAQDDDEDSRRTYISVDEQVEDCTEAIEDHEGWQVGEVFRDPAKSAWNPKVVRPEWNRLMERLESGQSDGVMVYDLTRFTRKPIEGERLIAAAERGLVVASVENSYDLMDPDSRSHFRNDMTAAAKESDKTSQRSTRGKRKAATRGRSKTGINVWSNGGSRGYAMPGLAPRPEGWEPGDPQEPVSAEQVEHERTIVRELTRRLLAGESINGIVMDLNRRRVTLHGRPWRGTGLRQVMTRPALAGLIEYKGEIVGVLEDPETGDPLPTALDRDTWDAVQALFDGRRRGRPRRDAYLLSGVIRCGKCGRTLNGRPRPPRADGTPRRQYWCQTGAPGGCGLAIDADHAERLVELAVKGRLADPRLPGRVAKAKAKAQARRAKLRADIEREEEAAESIAAKTGTGPWTEARVEAALESIDKRLAKLRAERDQLGATEPAVGTLDVEADWKKADVPQRRRMVRLVFPKLTIKPATSRRKVSLDYRDDERFDWLGETLPAGTVPRG